MVLIHILAELMCNGIFSLFLAPLLPKKKDKFELDNKNIKNFDLTNPEDNSKLSDKVADIQWWDGEILNSDMNKNFKKRCKYYFDIVENDKKRKKRCKNYHDNLKYCDEHSE